MCNHLASAPRASGHAAGRPRHPTQTAAASRPLESVWGTRACDAAPREGWGRPHSLSSEHGAIECHPSMSVARYRKARRASPRCMHGRRRQPQTRPYAPRRPPRVRDPQLGRSWAAPRSDTPVLTNLTSPNTGIRKDALLMSNATSGQKSKCCTKSSHASMTKRPEKPTSSNSTKDATFKLQIIRCRLQLRSHLGQILSQLKSPPQKKEFRGV